MISLLYQGLKMQLLTRRISFFLFFSSQQFHSYKTQKISWSSQCCILAYTSGTTGNPKGTMLSHDAVSAKEELNNIFEYFHQGDLHGNTEHRFILLGLRS